MADRRDVEAIAVPPVGQHDVSGMARFLAGRPLIVDDDFSNRSPVRTRKRALRNPPIVPSLRDDFVVTGKSALALGRRDFSRRGVWKKHAMDVDEHVARRKWER